jgi:CheY-like chemotaxis protein
MTADPAPQHVPPAETILFVEDEALVRMDLAQYLRECGYPVHEAANANEAMEALQSKFAIDVVFTDIKLPGEMNGLDLADWTLANRPGVKVIVTTGDPARTELPDAVGSILAKPYTGRDLLGRVQQALRTRSQSVNQPVSSE